MFKFCCEVLLSSLIIINTCFRAFRLDLPWLPLNLLEMVCAVQVVYIGGLQMGGVDVEETERNQTFAAMFRTYHYMKLFHNVVFMVSFRREKGSSFTGTYFLIN